MNSRTELGSNLKEYNVIRSISILSMVNPADNSSPTSGRSRWVSARLKRDINYCGCTPWHDPVYMQIGRRYSYSWQKSRCSLFFTWERWQWRGAQQEEATQLSAAIDQQAFEEEEGKALKLNRCM